MKIKKIHQQLIKKELSVAELVKSFLSEIEKEDKKIHSFLSLDSERVLTEAKKAQDKINRGGDVPLLCGIPCAIKDNILVEGLKCTAGSKILEEYVSPYDATVIKKLKREGAIILGKTNLDEFAMGSSTENSAFDTTRHPDDLNRVPGGSSGGSAAALRAGFCQFALGSDTGGSIRQPASFCGVVGLKPTYGAVSRYGLIAMASSLDQIGPMTGDIEDAKIVFDAIKGKDIKDSTSVDLEIIGRKTFKNKLRIGIPKEYFVEGVDKRVKAETERAIEKMEKSGVKIQEVSLPHTKYALPTYYLVMSSEASTNLARYDGIRYGIKESQISKLKIQNLVDFYSKVRGRYFGREVRRRITLGTFALSVGYYDEYYVRAQKVRRLIKEDFDKVFSSVDLILTPVSPTAAFMIGEKIEDPLQMYLADIFTIGVNLAGLPAISLPFGKIDNLPVGVQLIARAFEEEKIFQAGAILEKT
ncbi:MAG: Asp-tRNA(Asn)/Glu-tRNA(Gln) amidotransferase subunit GatA [Patescibacteria group bacterium]